MDPNPFQLKEGASKTFSFGTVWLYMWSVPHNLWGLRVGKQWFPAHDITVTVPIKTVFGQRNPRGRLTCKGQVTLTRKSGKILAEVHDEHEEPPSRSMWPNAVWPSGMD